MSVDGEALRRVAGHFPTGVTVVTAAWEGRPCGLTINSFASVSLDPPTVLVCVSRAARANACIEAAGRYAVNVLAEGQEALARVFASKTESKFAGVAYHTSPNGAPIFDGAHAWIECDVVARHPGGHTHTIYVGRVTALGTGQGRPLIVHGGRFARVGGAVQ